MLQDPLALTRKQSVGSTILLGGQKLVVDERYLRSLKTTVSILVAEVGTRGRPTERFAPRAKTSAFAICHISRNLSILAPG